MAAVGEHGDQLVGPGCQAAAAEREGCLPDVARQRSMVAIACLRGLLLQRLLTGSAEVDAAAESFFASLAPA